MGDGQVLAYAVSCRIVKVNLEKINDKLLLSDMTLLELSMYMYTMSVDDWDVFHLTILEMAKTENRELPLQAKSRSVRNPL